VPVEKEGATRLTWRFSTPAPMETIIAQVHTILLGWLCVRLIIGVSRDYVHSFHHSCDEVCISSRNTFVSQVIEVLREAEGQRIRLDDLPKVRHADTCI
jgi:hypothetical protein